MTELPDFMKDIGEFVDKLTPDWDSKKTPHEEASATACENAECPLHISKEGFRDWLTSYLSNTDTNRGPHDGKVFVVGVAFSDRNPIVRYLHYLCPSDVGDLKIATLGKRLILNRSRHAEATDAFTHPLVPWAVDYIEKLRHRFRAGESIGVNDAIELLD